MNLNKLSPNPSPEMPAPGGAAKNVLAKDVEIKGTIKFENELICDGKIEGEIISDGVLVIGKNAEIKGEVKTKAVTVHGTVLGNITAVERVELKASSQLTGDMKAARVVIEEGATFVGKSEVTPNKSAIRPSEDRSSGSANSGNPSSSSPSSNQPDRSKLPASV